MFQQPTLREAGEGALGLEEGLAGAPNEPQGAWEMSNRDTNC